MVLLKLSVIGAKWIGTAMLSDEIGINPLVAPGMVLFGGAVCTVTGSGVGWLMITACGILGNLMNDQTLKQIQEDAARQAILDAARKIIVKSGAESLSMRVLAKQVGCSPATIYKYFENKDDMLEAIRQEGWRLMNELDVEEDQPDLPILQRLELLSQIFQKFPSRYPEHYLMMFGSIDAAPMTIGQVLDDEGHLALSAVLQQSMESGEIRSDQYTPQQLALLIWFLSHGVAMLNLTIFRHDDEFLRIANEVLMAFATTLIKEN